jgi:hypothetical protein
VIVTREVLLIDNANTDAIAASLHIPGVFIFGHPPQNILTWYSRSPSGQPISVGIDLARFDTKCFFLKNQGPTFPLDNVRVEATNVPPEQQQPSDWELIDGTTFQGLPAVGNPSRSKVFTGDSRRYWRVLASSTNSAVVYACVSAR